MPPLATAFACEAIFGVPAATLFAGVREGAEKTTRKRLLKLRSKLESFGRVPQKKSEAHLTEQKLRWLDARAPINAAEKFQHHD